MRALEASQERPESAVPRFTGTSRARTPCWAAWLARISHTLRDGGQHVQESASSASQALLGLVAWQLDFALTEPELILIYGDHRRACAESAPQ